MQSAFFPPAAQRQSLTDKEPFTLCEYVLSVLPVVMKYQVINECWVERTDRATNWTGSSNPVTPKGTHGFRRWMDGRCQKKTTSMHTKSQGFLLLSPFFRQYDTNESTGNTLTGMQSTWQQRSSIFFYCISMAVGKQKGALLPPPGLECGVSAVLHQ